MAIRQKTTAGGETLFELHPQNGHGLIRPSGPPGIEIVRHVFGDVEGAQHMIGKPGEQQVLCEGEFTGFVSYSELMTWLNTLYTKAGQLTGEILLTRGAVHYQSPPATFLGFVPQLIFPDGSGEHGWVCLGMFLWVLRGPA